MTLETMAANEAIKATQTTLKVVETSIKKAWSLLDAATEKQRPSEVLSQQAIQAIQGNITSDR